MTIPEESDPVKSLHLDRTPDERAHIWASIDIARKYLYGVTKDGYFIYDSESHKNLLRDLQDKVFPGLHNIEIRDILSKQGWPKPIVTPNNNKDPNDQEEFEWYPIYDGTIFRNPTERESYAELCRKAKERETQIERYCYDIRGIEPWYNLPYPTDEELERDRARLASEKKRGPTEDQLKYQQYSEALHILERKDKPEGMTNKEWAAKRREARKLRKEIKKQNKDDFDLKYHHSSVGIFEHRVNKLRSMCYCTAEGMRKGYVCKVCKLTKKVDDYMMSLFKDAAEGRSSVI